MDDVPWVPHPRGGPSPAGRRPVVQRRGRQARQPTSRAGFPREEARPHRGWVHVLREEPSPIVLGPRPSGGSPSPSGGSHVLRGARPPSRWVHVLRWKRGGGGGGGGGENKGMAGWASRRRPSGRLPRPERLGQHILRPRCSRLITVPTGTPSCAAASRYDWSPRSTSSITTRNPSGKASRRARVERVEDVGFRARERLGVRPGARVGGEALDGVPLAARPAGSGAKNAEEDLLHPGAKVRPALVLIGEAERAARVLDDVVCRRGVAEAGARARAVVGGGHEGHRRTRHRRRRRARGAGEADEKRFLSSSTCRRLRHPLRRCHRPSPRSPGSPLPATRGDAGVSGRPPVCSGDRVLRARSGAEGLF